MATRNEKHSCGWVNSDFKLTDEFKEGSFEEIKEYATDNQKNLMTIWFNHDSAECGQALALGSSFLNFFEHFLIEEESEKTQSVFELGKLSGYLECLGTIRYENHMNSLAFTRYSMLVKSYPQYSDYFGKVLYVLYTEGAKKKEKLKKILSLQQDTLDNTLQYLCKSGFIHYYENGEYSIADSGIRIVSKCK